MKTILITGSTDGIGKLTALKLAKEGHDIYLQGRNEAKLNSAISELKEASKNQNIKGYVADFSDLLAVKQMASDIKNDLPKLDILINNAGVLKTKDTFAKNGLDYRMVVNYLAPYLLTQSILPILEKGNHTRIVNLSSAAQSKVQKGVLTGDATVNSSESYAQSKLALTMWSFSFAKNHPNIITLAVNPGSLLNTKMANEAYGQHWSPADKGADILYDLAVSERHKTQSGTYFDNDKGMYANAHPDAYNTDKINALLTLTESIISS
ncbi:SDR family NAD(P)-dependent oxidoreductase [Algibacter pectinivorans]|uniref:NAD(P)-dependent dehydrogenase, short-chain alcohol dehydrogenase family n=1 Tax=Algibacter pectinivorans TaxID=870482 RepID=A0A1I1S4V7_9FLAO|nr:SDR family NAD(P)-dependent oxidoreductase [Algibacter pectinivorans]SFD39588.1 NAD(P)-dependent dehydrogenase, short-chain alcohol dehydrogenase family [Algibacter pectinivorans]